MKQRITMKTNTGIAALCGVMAMMVSGCASVQVPPGAAELGYTKCILNERPTVADITGEKTGNFKWFSGQWYNAKPPSLDHYVMIDGVLALKLGGDLVSAPRDLKQAGALPLLPGKDGFYVEFDTWISANDPDHWPAVWLMPFEHNGRQEDRLATDPKGFQRFMELDVDEGGFGPGLTGTVHSSEGNWPKYKHVQNPNNVRKEPLDRSKKHTFGASYDPKSQTVTWWVDGVKQMSATAPYVPEIARQHRYYLIMSGQSHKLQKEHFTFISGVRAFVPAACEIPAAK